jgi:hypothetical protein
MNDPGGQNQVLFQSGTAEDAPARVSLWIAVDC